MRPGLAHYLMAPGRIMTSADPGNDLPVKDMFASQAGGPTVLRMVLGAQMRRLRRARGISLEAAGLVIHASGSKVSRLERGRVPCGQRDIADLLALYGIHGEQERAAMLQLAREANTPGWWHCYSSILPSWFESYVGLEEAASRIRTYEIQFVPGLLQTESYACTVIQRGNPEAAGQEIDERVALRMTRQAILVQPNAPQYWAVVHEGTLRRPLGSRQLMRGQIEHLMEMTRLPHVTLRVVPSAKEGMTGEDGPFTILRFSEPDLPDVVYLEHLTSAIYLDKRSDLERYLAVMDRLLLEAGPVAVTAEILKDICGDV
jgi:transcriptional regulator with XRE-family HTH domain